MKMKEKIIDKPELDTMTVEDAFKCFNNACGEKCRFVGYPLAGSTACFKKAVEVVEEVRRRYEK